MNIIINGKANNEFEGDLTVADLLEKLGLAGQSILVELDELALRPREFATTRIGDGAQLEIIRVAAGG